MALISILRPIQADIRADQYVGSLNLNGHEVSVFWRTSSHPDLAGWWYVIGDELPRGPFLSSQDAFFMVLVRTWNLS